jgi:plastocyanin domain-containing protein
MTLESWLVIGAGAAAIAWVNWYFFLAPRATVSARPGPAGIQIASVTVKGGYEPAAIRVRHGAPVRVVFDRKETDSCSEEVVFPDFGIRRSLPAFKKTAVEFTPAEPGVYPFTCGMGMLHGTVTAE